MGCRNNVLWRLFLIWKQAIITNEDVLFQKFVKFIFKIQNLMVGINGKGNKVYVVNLIGQHWSLVFVWY